MNRAGPRRSSTPPEVSPGRSWLARAGRAAASRPGLQLFVVGVVLAIGFPGRSTGALGLTIVCGGLGVAIAQAWPTVPAWLRRPPAGLATVVVLSIVAAIGVVVFWDALTIAPDWPMGDWGPQHAVLAGVTPSMPGLDLPVWNHAVGTGDAPLELYPSLTYLVAGHLAAALGLTGELPLALMIVAVIVHITLAVATTAIAIHVAPRPIALAVGLLTLVDTGAVAHGGTVGLFRWALLHSALALAFATIASLGVLAAVRRPRLGASVTIWLFTALATATHPAGLLAAAAIVLGLAAVALLATDVPPRRALVAIGHVTLGVALGAVVWLPLTARLLAYGQHFPNALRSPGRLLEDLLAAPSPVTAYAMLGYAGYLGILAGLWSRRASVVLIATTALVLLLGLSDAVFLAFDVAPGMGVARLGTERLAALARPFVVAAGAYGIAVVIGAAIRGWRDASPGRRLIAAALIGIMTGAIARVVPSVWGHASDRASAETQVFAADPLGRQLLERWARDQVQTITPATWGRALFEQDTHEHLHLTATTGLPTLHLTWIPDLLLRERIEDLSEASLARFNIRWVVGVDQAPTLGDPATERTFGRYRVRELASWDGKFARIERGTGTVTVVRLDDRAVEVEVTGTTEPVLVALGTGYYPRWRARHASGVAEPVYALSSTPTAKLHVVSAWLAPGRTTFTVDGPLPSDHRGRLLSGLAALLAVTGIVVWRIRRTRLRVLRRLARARARLPWLAGVAARYGIPVVALGLVVRGCVVQHAPIDALELGSGLRATATVEAREVDGAWQPCGYVRLEATYRCAGLVTVADGMVALLNDAHPSWAFNTPGLVATPDIADVELRIRVDARLAGTYWTASSGGTVTLAVEGDAPRAITRAVEAFADRGERTVELRALLASASTWSFTLVHESTLVPRRPFLAAPPELAPPAVRAIR